MDVSTERCEPAQLRSRSPRWALCSLIACDIWMQSWQCFVFPAVPRLSVYSWVIKLWTNKQIWESAALKNRRSQEQFPVSCFAQIQLNVKVQQLSVLSKTSPSPFIQQQHLGTLVGVWWANITCKNTDLSLFLTRV